MKKKEITNSSSKCGFIFAVYQKGVRWKQLLWWRNYTWQHNRICFFQRPHLYFCLSHSSISSFFQFFSFPSTRILALHFLTLLCVPIAIKQRQNFPAQVKWQQRRENKNGGKSPPTHLQKTKHQIKRTKRESTSLRQKQLFWEN